MRLIKLLIYVVVTFALNGLAVDLSVTLQNTGTQTGYGVQLKWRATSSPVGTSLFMNAGTVSQQSTYNGTASGWAGPSFGGLNQSPYVWVTWYASQNDANLSQNMQSAGPFTYSGTTATFTFSPGGFATTWKVTFCGQNNTAWPKAMGLFKDGVLVGGGYLFVPKYSVVCKTVALSTGESTNGYGVFDVEWPDGVQNADGSWSYPVDPVQGDIPRPATWAQNADPSSPDANTWNPNAPANAVPSTNTPIAFSGNDTVATLKEGFNQVYTGIKQTGADTVEGLNVLHNDNVQDQTLQKSQNSILTGIGASASATATAVDVARVSITNATWSVNNNVAALLGDARMTATNSRYLTNLLGVAQSEWLNTSNANVKMDAANTLLTSVKNNTQGAVDHLAGVNANTEASKLTLNDIQGNVATSKNTLQAIDANGRQSSNTLGAIMVDGRFTTNALGQINAIMSDSTNLLRQIKDGIAGTGTNDGGTASAVRNMHTDTTNWLARIDESLNRTNLGDGSWTNMDSKFSDAEGAQTAAQAALGSANGNFDGMVAGVNNGWEHGSSDGTPFSFSIFTGANTPSIDINPWGSDTVQSGFLGVFAAMKNMWVLILIIGYSLKVIQDIERHWSAMVAARGAQVQAFQLTFFGSGGNMAGAALLPVIVAAGLALYAAMLAVTFSNISGIISWASLWSNVAGMQVIATIAAPAKWLLNQTFPVQLCMSLAAAYLTFRITSAKAVVGFTAATKFLMGW